MLYRSGLMKIVWPAHIPIKAELIATTTRMITLMIAGGYRESALARLESIDDLSDPPNSSSESSEPGILVNSVFSDRQPNIFLYQVRVNILG